MVCLFKYSHKTTPQVYYCFTYFIGNWGLERLSNLPRVKELENKAFRISTQGWATPEPALITGILRTVFKLSFTKQNKLPSSCFLTVKTALAFFVFWSPETQIHDPKPQRHLAQPGWNASLPLELPTLNPGLSVNHWNEVNFPRLLKERDVSWGHMILHPSAFPVFHLIFFCFSLFICWPPQMLMILGSPLSGLFALFTKAWPFPWV